MTHIPLRWLEKKILPWKTFNLLKISLHLKIDYFPLHVFQMNKTVTMYSVSHDSAWIARNVNEWIYFLRLSIQKENSSIRVSVHEFVHDVTGR